MVAVAVVVVLGLLAVHGVVRGPLRQVKVENLPQHCPHLEAHMLVQRLSIISIALVPNTLLGL